MADRLGIVYVELDLDKTKFERNQQQIIQQANSTALSIEKNYQILGVKSDNIYNAMAQGARNAYERIANASKVSADEQFRAQSAMVAKINSLNQEMTKNPLYEQMGIRSMAAINAQKNAVMLSYDTLKTAAAGNATEIVRLEKAKNEKLKELNKEMTGQHEMSMASMTRAVLRFYAAYYVISNVVRVGIDFFMGGVKAIDDMKLSTIGVAAQITTMQGTTGDIAKNYKDNLKYAEALIPVLQQIDVNSFANLSQIQKMNMAMSMQGTILDVNNAKQIESFTALTNAVALFTQGQDKERQASQEIRALFSGQVKQGNMVALMIDQQIKKTGEYKDGLKGLVEEGRKYGNTLELLTPYLTGIIAASGDIQSTWAAVSASIETTWNIMQRGLFKDAYKSLVESGQVATTWLKANQDEVVQYIKIAWGFISDIFQSAWNVLKGFIPIMKDFGKLMAPIVYGWGGVLAALKPIGEAIGNTVAMTYELGKAIVSTAMAGSRLAVFDFEGAKLYWDEAKKGYSEVWRLQKKNFELVTTGVADSIVAYDKQYEAAKKSTNAKVTAPAIPPGADKAEKDSVKDHMEMLRSKMQADKAYYEEQVNTAEQVAKLAQRAGQDEYKTIKNLYDAKETALNNYLETQYQNAEKQTQIEADAAKISKDGVAKKFDYIAVLQAKYDAIYAKYNKDWAKSEGDRAIANEDAAKKTVEVMANLYKTISGYSDEAISYQIKQLEEKYIQEGRYAKGSLALAVALKVEKDKLYQNQSKSYADFYLTILGYEEDYRDWKLDWIDKEEERLKKFYEDDVAAAKWAADEKGKLEQELFEKKTKYISDGFGDLQSSFTAISKLYAEGSADARKWQEAAKAMEIAQRAVAVVNAVAAIANQGLGDPYTAFARIAAMVAIMGALLASIGESVGGSSIASIAPSLPASTVLGAEAGTGSESISKSWELMQDTYDMEYRELSGIYSEMKDLNDNITGLVTGIIRTGSIGNFGIAEGETIGSIQSTWDSIVSITYLGTRDLFNTITLGISGWIDNAISNLVGSIFGGGTSTSIAGTGIKTGNASISDLLAGGGIGARAYTKVRVDEDGGWFGSDSTYYYTRYKALDANVSNLLDKVFRNMGTTMIELSREFGTDVNAALNYVFKGASINLKGMDSEAINKKLTEYFSGIGDTAVEALFGSIVSQYQKVGEGLMETASRILIDKAVILDTLEMTRQAFSGTISQVIAFSEAIITMAGDLETLRGYAETYYDKFFSDEEKQLRLQGQLTSVLSDFNMALPLAREGYRALVEGLDLSTESGQRAYVALLSLAEGADQYYQVIDETTDAQNELTKSLAALTETIDEWLSKLNRGTLSPGGTSANAWITEYQRYQGMATAQGATPGAITDYLNYATDYLTFMQQYTGAGAAYQQIYDQVVADVMGIRASLPGNAAGGLTSGLSYAGEIGPEWVVPTYEPQRSNFLASVGVDSEVIGKSIARTLMNEATGGSANGKDIHVHLYIDKKEITGAIVQGIRGGDEDLIKNLKKAVN
jgi:hypothetical protein